MDNLKYRGIPKIEIQNEEDFLRAIFHSGNKVNDWKNGVIGKKFKTGEEADSWANRILAMARTKNSSFESLSWGDQTPTLEGIIKYSSDKNFKRTGKNELNQLILSFLVFSCHTFF